MMMRRSRCLNAKPGKRSAGCGLTRTLFRRGNGAGYAEKLSVTRLVTA